MLLLKGRSMAVLMIQKLINFRVLALDVFAFTFLRFSYVFICHGLPRCSRGDGDTSGYSGVDIFFAFIMSDGCLILFLPEQKKIKSRTHPVT
jgi:hypothetical protein